MKATGITRKIDDLGRVCLPKELCRTLDIKHKDALEIYVDGQDIILRKYNPGCTFCGSVDGVDTYKGKPICKRCAAGIAKGGVIK